MGQWKLARQIAADVQSQKTTATEQVEKALKLIESKQEYKSIIATTSERAIERAKEIDKKIAAGEEVGRLAGVPFVAKDNFLTFGAETTAASNILRGFNAPYQATVIELLEAEGAICVAKANLDAFAHGSSTENSDFFTTLNPHDKSKVPGGSSGGSASAVVLDLVPFALGTDTGGSIRLPAAFCGAVGLKPSYGLVSRSGVVAMASSLDVIGPITRTVEDAALVLDVIAGKDELDGTTIEPDKEGYDISSEKTEANQIKLGVVKEYLEGLDEKIKKQVEDAVEKLKKQGAQVKHISLPSLPLALAVYYIVCPAEIGSNLSRYDGQRFGFTYDKARNLEESYTRSRSIGFNKENKRRIIIGTYVLSSGYYDAYYKRAQIVRTKLINEFKEAFEEVDFLIGPTAPTTAFEIGQKANPLDMYLTDVMTVAVNLVGIPAISLPVGEIDGLPVGLQIMAPQNRDRSLLKLAKLTEETVR